MRAFLAHVDRIKEKPHHVRRQFALLSAFGITAFVAVLWLVIVLSTGTFAIQGSSFAESTRRSASLAATPEPGGSSLIGAAAGAFGFDTRPAHIEIVRTATSSTLSGKSEPQAEQTVIPF